jgi:hypothetical protein
VPKGVQVRLLSRAPFFARSAAESEECPPQIRGSGPKDGPRPGELRMAGHSSPRGGRRKRLPYRGAVCRAFACEGRLPNAHEDAPPAARTVFAHWQRFPARKALALPSAPRTLRRLQPDDWLLPCRHLQPRLRPASSRPRPRGLDSQPWTTRQRTRRPARISTRST